MHNNINDRYGNSKKCRMKIHRRQHWSSRTWEDSNSGLTKCYTKIYTETQLLSRTSETESASLTSASKLAFPSRPHDGFGDERLSLGAWLEVPNVAVVFEREIPMKTTSKLTSKVNFEGNFKNSREFTVRLCCQFVQDFNRNPCFSLLDTHFYRRRTCHL